MSASLVPYFVQIIIDRVGKFFLIDYKVLFHLWRINNFPYAIFSFHIKGTWVSNATASINEVSCSPWGIIFVKVNLE